MDQTTFDMQKHCMDLMQLLFFFALVKGPETVITYGVCFSKTLLNSCNKKTACSLQTLKDRTLFLVLEYVAAVDKGVQHKDADVQNHGPCL